MPLSPAKTKIVCTIGPASESSDAIERMIAAGMNVARLNFSHGDFDTHLAVIERLHAAERATGRRIAIMADLPGPKIRIGNFAEEPVVLEAGDDFTLTTKDIVGDATRVSVTSSRLPRSVKPGDRIHLNDGFIELQVKAVNGDDVRCGVVVGGELRSRKGLNLPGIDLGIGAFTDRDRECLEFALKNGVDAVSQSFVESAADVRALREAAGDLGHQPFVVAKIERAGALDHIEDIVQEADGIMIARGDLGVEVPIEQIAVVQKRVIRLANRLAKPVITATQMLESMTSSRRPTRAEATDVANAILDGTDCVMLSAESAVGAHPVEAVAMLSKIATATEPSRRPIDSGEFFATEAEGSIAPAKLVDLSVRTVLEYAACGAVFVPTYSGDTARSISRFRLPVWVIAVSDREESCQHLHFSYGVRPVFVPELPEQWNDFIKDWLRENDVEANLVVMTQGPTAADPGANPRLEIIELTGSSQ